MNLFLSTSSKDNLFLVFLMQFKDYFATTFLTYLTRNNENIIIFNNILHIKKNEIPIVFFFFLKKWRQQDISSFQHYELRHSMLSSSVMIIDAKATAIHFALLYGCTICELKTQIPEK